MIFFGILCSSLFFLGCQNSKKEVLNSWGELVDVVNLNNLEYKLQYEPHLVKLQKTNEVNEQDEDPSQKFKDHHYLNLSINGLQSDPSIRGKDNYAVLSEYLSEEFKDQFYLIVNGERKACVLHHAFFPPQNTNTIMIQLVFKDKGFSEQANYFQEDLLVVYFDKKTRESVQWSFSYEGLNKFPTLNNNYNG